MTNTLAFLFWLLLAVFVNLLPPENMLIKSGLFLIIFGALFSSVRVFYKNFKINFLIALFITLLLFLQFIHVLSLLNLTLLSVLFVAVYFITKPESDNPKSEIQKNRVSRK